MQYRTRGTCSQVISFNVDDNDVVSDVSFLGGCDGNLKAVGKLVEGMDADQVITLLKGNTCGRNFTSCADQLSKALKAALASEK